MLRTITYKCLEPIYQQGKNFGESGRLLIESGNNNLFIPGMINICLSAELLLKSINASITYIEDELEINGAIVYQGRDNTQKINPSAKGHNLSKLFSNLPSAIQSEITKFARDERYNGCVCKGLEKYDTTFVNWRYIYEDNAQTTLGTHPLFPIVNAIAKYCETYCGCVTNNVSEKVSS